MTKHNFGFVTKWEVLDCNGKVIRRSDTTVDNTPEGEIEAVIDGEHGIIEHKQPMRSYTVGMLECMLSGHRLAQRNDNYQQTSGSSIKNVMIGTNTSPTYVQQVHCIKPFATYSTSAYTVSPVSSDTSPVTLIGDLIDDSENRTTKARLNVTRTISSGSGTLGEISLWSDNNKMLMRDVISYGGRFLANEVLGFSFVLNFPSTVNHTITKNWIYNFLGNLTAGTKIVNTTGDEVALTSTTSATFTKVSNCEIKIGSDNGTLLPISADNYTLGKILTSVVETPMIYESQVTLRQIAGKASVSLSQDFTNNSGNTITVNEACLVAKSDDSEGVTVAGRYMLARWLTGSITLRPTEILRVYFQPTITATPEVITNLTGIIVISDAIRENYPELANISMIQKEAATNKNWVQAMEYAESLSLDVYSDWRLPRGTGNVSDFTPANEIIGIWRGLKDGIFAITNPNQSYPCWSSTEKASSAAWDLHINTTPGSGGTYGGGAKTFAHDNALCVR